MPGRHLPAFGFSAIVHAAVLLVLILIVQRTAERQLSPASSPGDSPPLAHLIWLAAPGDGGGGGGGGNQMPEPPRQLQRPGRNTVSVPPIEPRSAPDAAEPASEQMIEAPVLPLASADVTLPGAIEPRSLAMVSLGPGRGDGAGAGDGAGIGDGPGNGLGPGRADGAGGLNGRGAGLVLPTVLRDVKPRYTAEAMRARVEGAVVVSAIVQADGTVRDVQVLRSLDPVFGLDQAAVNAARQWLFRPGLMAGLPVPVAVTIELSFNLR
jgi:protein TonB